MYFHLTEALKSRLIKELRHYWSFDPRYQDLVDNIQGKYSFDERPQYGIIVKVGSANKVQFSADNYMGVVESYVALARIPGHPGLSVEWVREDSGAIQENGGKFPSPAGVYYCEMVEDDVFFVDPLLEVRDERVTMVTSSEGVIQNIPFEGSLRLFEMPGGKLLHAGRDFTIGDGTTIYLASPLPNGAALSADYRYPGESSGPWQVLPQSGMNQAIPGVVMAFGRKFQKGDRWAVTVSETREEASLQYGGRWEMSVDIDIIARDVSSQMEIADQTAMYLWATLRSQLVNEGIDIQDVSMGGESEEIYDENADDYFYNSSISLSVHTDWFLFVPIVGRILAYAETIKELPRDLRLQPFSDPFFSGKFDTFEMIR